MEGSRPFTTLPHVRLPMITQGEPPPVVSPPPLRTFPLSYCVRTRTSYCRRFFLLMLLHLCLMMCLMLTCSRHGLCSAAPVPPWRSADTNLTTVTWTGLGVDTETGLYTTNNTTDDKPTFTPGAGNAHTSTSHHSPPSSPQKPRHPQLTSTRRSAVGVKTEVTPEHPPQSLLQVRSAPVGEQQQGVGVNPGGAADTPHTPHVPAVLLRTGSDLSDVTTQPEVTDRQDDDDGDGEGVTGDLLDDPGTLSTTLLTELALITTREESVPSIAPTTGSVEGDYTSVSDGDVTTGSEGQLVDITVTQDVSQVSDTTQVVDPDTAAWHSSPEPQHGGTDAAVSADDDDVGTGSASPRQLLTTMLIVAHAQTTSKRLAPTITESYPPKDADISIDDDSSWYKGNKSVSVDDLQFDLEDLILAVCGTAASTFTVCMLVTFTRCCCKKQKDDSDGEDASTRRGHRHHHGAGSASAASASSSSSHRSKSLWKRSWKRPLDSGATTATQESSTSADNITQVTIERRESYTDEQDSDLSDGYDEDDDEGGFTKGGRRKRHGDANKSRKPHSKDSDDNATAPSVRDRIRAFEVPSPGTQGEVKVREGIKPRKNKPTSKAFSEFESKGILIGFGGPRGRHGADEEDEDEDRGGSCDSPLGVLLPSPTSGQSLEDTPTSSRGLDDDEGVHTMESEEDEFAAIQRSGEVLKSFRRAPPPRNRSRARRSGRGRRQIRGQDVSSSEQIAEEPSSGSFGSRPTSGINSPATSATPEEEEHETFEASLHMGTNESLSVARSSSISQTPQSSLDSMDSPKRQPSVSSRDSPLRGGGGVGDSPKRLLDSPKRQQRRAAGDTSSRRTPPLGPRSPVASLRPCPGEVADSGHNDFSLTIPVEFQQQRLGSQSADKAVPHSSGRPRRPISYHVEPSSRGGATEKFRPLRPLSTHQGHQYPGVVDPDVPSSTDNWPPPTCSPNSHEAPLRAHEQTHLHEPPRPHRDSISLSHGHLGRDLQGTPVGRVLPQVRGPASPVEMRRWESEHSYLQQEEARKPSQLRKDGGGRGRGQEPEPTSSVASRSRQTLRPTPEDAQVRDHPQSEKLERKVLKMETPPGTAQGPDFPNQSGGIEVQISKTDAGRTNAEIPPPRPPLPSWRKMKPACDTSNQFPLPPRQLKLTLSTRSRSFHVIDPRQRQSKSVDVLPQRGHSRYSGDQPDGLEYDITPDDLRKTWDGMVRSRSLERPTKRLNAQFSPEPYSNHYYSLDNYDDLIKSNSLDVSPDQIRISQAFPYRTSVVKSKSLEMSPERLNRHHQWRNIETELPEPSYDEVDNINGSIALFRPLPTRKSWHGNTKSPKREKPQPKSACGDVPWLRDKDNEENLNLKPSDIRKSMRESRSHSSSVLASSDAHTNSGGKLLTAGTFKDNRTLSQNWSTKTEGQVAHVSLDFKRNVPQSQSVRSPKSPPEYRRADVRYSMRDKSSNWRNVRGGGNSHHSQPKDQRPELTLHTSAVPAANPLVHSAAETYLPKKAINHKTCIEEPVPPRPPLPTENSTQPVKHHTTAYGAQHKYKTPGTTSPAGLPTSVPIWGPKYENPNKSYMAEETSLDHNQHHFQGRPKDLHRPPSVDVPPNLVTPEGSLKRQTSLKVPQLVRQSIGSDAASYVPVTALGTEKYWSMERPSVIKKGQPAASNTGQFNTELEEVSWEPDVVENIKTRKNSESEQMHGSQFLGNDLKPGYPSVSDWSAPSNHTDNTMASGHTYVDMTQNLKTDHFSEVSASPHRPKSTHDELSPVPLSCTFSEPSPVPSDLPPSEHVLRFTRDPRWKESLVKPEAKSMYEVMHGQDVSNVPGFPYTFTPEDHILEAMPTSLLRDTPDVVPLSERRISPRVTTGDNELKFTFNFDTEATEI